MSKERARWFVLAVIGALALIGHYRRSTRPSPEERQRMEQRP